MNTINAHDLKHLLDSDDAPFLINAMEENKFRAKHIPGSLNLFRREDIEQQLKKDDTIVVYCTDQACNKSIMLYQLLEVLGYNHVSRFSGGMMEWENAGFPLEGDMIS